jgi:hypothetical protein
MAAAATGDTLEQMDILAFLILPGKSFLLCLHFQLTLLPTACLCVNKHNTCYKEK